MNPRNLRIHIHHYSVRILLRIFRNLCILPYRFPLFRKLIGRLYHSNRQYSIINVQSGASGIEPEQRARPVTSTIDDILHICAPYKLPIPPSRNYFTSSALSATHRLSQSRCSLISADKVFCGCSCENLQTAIR